VKYSTFWILGINAKRPGLNYPAFLYIIRRQKGNAFFGGGMCWDETGYSLLKS